ncbi:MAG TPA: AAA family ATPase, partial [Burkholderiales bacterium]|nr:AAA family ATPase [Burkholderiales bacterium]
MRELIEQELRGTSVFKDQSKLAFEYVPENLPGRDGEMRQLAQAFRGLLAARTPANVTITGPVGSGKTALSKRFCMEFSRAAKERNVALEWVDVNCRRRPTEGAALLKILQHFDARFPDRGFSTAEMLENLRAHLARRNAHLIVVLDEADVLVKRGGGDLIYHLTRFNEDTTGGTVSLILAGLADPRKLLDEAAASSLKIALSLEFGRYNQAQLHDITRQRVELAFHSGTVPEELEVLIADIASEYGNARFAIELLEKAGIAADGEGLPRLSAEHVRAAKAETHSVVTESKLRELDRHKQLVLLGVARSLRRGDAFVTTGDAEERYKVACEEHGEPPRAHTQYWTYIKDLESVGLIGARKSG